MITPHNEPAFDILGIAAILPLDHIFVLSREQRWSSMKAELEAIPLPLPPYPHVSFKYNSYQRSGGGKIANIVAYLGMAGHRAVLCGAVGADASGTDVIAELQNHQINTDHIFVDPDKHTRVVFIVQQPGHRESEQFYLQDRPLRYRPSFLKGLPTAKVIVVGRANQSVNRYVKQAKENPDVLVAFHLNDFPWRSTERTPGITAQSLCAELIDFADVLVIRKPQLRAIRTYYGLKPKTPLIELAGRMKTPLIVIYGGINDVTAIYKPQGESSSQIIHLFQPESSLRFGVRDSTGMIDCFHAALLQFFFKRSEQKRGLSYMTTALGYANHIAALQGTGIGARSFPPVAEQETIMERYLPSTPEHVFISYVHEDFETVQRLRTDLEDHGIRVWMDVDMPPGVRWADAIRNAIRQGAFFLACFSTAYATRERTYMNEELTIAIEELRLRPTSQVWFIPVVVDNCEVPDRSIGAGETLRSLQWVRLFENWEQGMRRILSAIRPGHR